MHYLLFPVHAEDNAIVFLFPAPQTSLATASIGIPKKNWQNFAVCFLRQFDSASEEYSRSLPELLILPKRHRF